MLDARDKVAGTIELRRTDDGPRYRVEVAGGEVLGWRRLSERHGAAAPRHHLGGRARWRDQRFVTVNEA